MNPLVLLWMMVIWALLISCGDPEPTKLQIEEKPAKHLREKNGND